MSLKVDETLELVNRIEKRVGNPPDPADLLVLFSALRMRLFVGLSATDRGVDVAAVLDDLLRVARLESAEGTPILPCPFAYWVLGQRALISKEPGTACQALRLVFQSPGAYAWIRLEGEMWGYRAKAEAALVIDAGADLVRAIVMDSRRTGVSGRFESARRAMVRAVTTLIDHSESSLWSGQRFWAWLGYEALLRGDWTGAVDALTRALDALDRLDDGWDRPQLAHVERDFVEGALAIAAHRDLKRAKASLESGLARRTALGLDGYRVELESVAASMLARFATEL